MNSLGFKTASSKQYIKQLEKYEYISKLGLKTNIEG